MVCSQDAGQDVKLVSLKGHLSTGQRKGEHPTFNHYITENVLRIVLFTHAELPCLLWLSSMCIVVLRINQSLGRFVLSVCNVVDLFHVGYKFFFKKWTVQCTEFVSGQSVCT